MTQRYVTDDSARTHFDDAKKIGNISETTIMQKPRKKKASHTRRKASTYTKGDLNKLVDTLIHPLAKTDKGFLLVDGVLHGLIEQNPPETVRKFLKYNLPKILQQLAKEASDQNE